MTNTNQKCGRIYAHARGFGFAETQDGGRYFVAPGLMKRLISEDEITFTVEDGKQPGEFQVGELLGINRSSRTILGVLETRGTQVWLNPDEPCFVGIKVAGVPAGSGSSWIAESSGVLRASGSTTVRDAPDVPGALKATGPAAGEVVAVRIPAATEATRVVEGEVAEVLGLRSRPGFDCDYAMVKFNLSRTTHEAAILEAETADKDVISRIGKGWEDLRQLPLVTIDNESTRDIDDAVSATRLKGKGRRGFKGFDVQVAIADVSAYVRPGSALEAQALERCTSVYIPGRTVPMLPEALSSDLGSLKADVPRLALVCQMRVGLQGQILESSFKRAVILSKARLSYGQVFARMSKGTAVSALPEVESSMDALQELYKILLAGRSKRGVLDFNDKEVKLKVRADGSVDVDWEHRNDAHKLVEEIMLLANQAAAQTLLARGAFGFYRHQAEPLAQDWQELKVWLAQRNISLSENPGEREAGSKPQMDSQEPSAQRPALKQLARVLRSVINQPDYAILDSRIRKVMQLAVYDNVSPEHFSLGYEAYTHFTSPLRRYSDLLVHRILLGEVIPESELKAAAQRCSSKSQASRGAERYVWDLIKKRALVRDVKKGKALKCHALNGNRRGLKVLVDDWQCTAFVPDDSLIKADFSWDQDAGLWEKAPKTRLESGTALKVAWERMIEEKGACEIIASFKPSRTKSTTGEGRTRRASGRNGKSRKAG